MVRMRCLATECQDGNPGILNLSELRSSIQLLHPQRDLQYSDLHGIPCLLILCQKGRMGDTFPQTFSCLDLRIRTSDNASTFVQELGRLCRYPSAPSPASDSPGSEQVATATQAAAICSGSHQLADKELLKRIAECCNKWEGRDLFPGESQYFHTSSTLIHQ